MKNTLNAKGIEYTISTDFDKLISNGFRSVPVLEKDGVMYDFDSAMTKFSKGEW